MQVGAHTLRRLHPKLLTVLGPSKLPTPSVAPVEIPVSKYVHYVVEDNCMSIKFMLRMMFRPSTRRHGDGQTARPVLAVIMKMIAMLPLVR